MDLYNIYEIYIKTEDGGSDIRFVKAKDRYEISLFPDFEEVITVNDYFGRQPLYNIKGELFN